MQSSQRGFWRLVQYPQQRLCSTCRATFALLPVADRIQRNVNALGKLRLAKTQTPAYATRKLGGIQQCLGVIGGFVLGDIRLIRCIDRAASIRPLVWLSGLYINRHANSFHSASLRGFSSRDDSDRIVTQFVNENEQRSSIRTINW